MSMGGIKIDPTVSAIYDDIKIHAMYRYIFFKIEDRKSVIIEETGDPSKTYDDFEQRLKEIEANRDCRYALFRFDIEHRGMQINAVAFIFWCPDSTRIQNKMMYSTTKDDIIKVFAGVSFEFFANTLDKLRYEDLKAEVIRKA